MLDTLFKILSWDLPSPEVSREDDGDLCLEWLDDQGWTSVSINEAGGVAWASTVGEESRHGTDIRRLEALLCGHAE